MNSFCRRRDGAYIELIPIDGTNTGQPHQALMRWDETAKSEDIVMSVEVGPCGYPGYNVSFSTDRSLDEILRMMADFINPNSRIHADDEEVGYNEMKLSEVPPYLMERMSKAKEMWLRLDQEEDTSKLKLFWYETPVFDEDWNIVYPGKEFAFNIDWYWEELMDMAYQITNFPVSPEDISWLRLILGHSINL